jgi:hypothetical protein
MANGALPQHQEDMNSRDNIQWHNVCDWGVEGKGWAETECAFDRLPTRAKAVVPANVWELSRHSTGLCARFQTDSPALYARWVLRQKTLELPHMPATSVSGVDVYGEDTPGVWKWVGVGPPIGAPNAETRITYGLESALRPYQLYLPLFNGVTSLEIGICPGCAFVPIPPRIDRPIVFYGTSVVQGIAASRSGMCHTAILGRWLHLPVINLGFAGCGKMDIPLAHVLLELDPAIYVIDCLPNMTSELVAERAAGFLEILARGRPNTPILLMEDRTYTSAWVVPALRERNAASRAALYATYKHMLSNSHSNIHYIRGEILLEADDESCVDGSHPTDVGFVHISRALIEPLRQLLHEIEG